MEPIILFPAALNMHMKCIRMNIYWGASCNMWHLWLTAINVQYSAAATDDWKKAETIPNQSLLKFGCGTNEFPWPQYQHRTQRVKQLLILNVLYVLLHKLLNMRTVYLTKGIHNFQWHQTSQMASFKLINNIWGFFGLVFFSTEFMPTD